MKKLPQSIVWFKKNDTWDVLIRQWNGQTVTVSFSTEKDAKNFAYSLPLFIPHCQLRIARS